MLNLTTICHARQRLYI